MFYAKCMFNSNFDRIFFAVFDLLLQVQRVWIEKTFQKRECVQILVSKDSSR